MERGPGCTSQSMMPIRFGAVVPGFDVVVGSVVTIVRSASHLPMATQRAMAAQRVLNHFT